MDEEGVSIGVEEAILEVGYMRGQANGRRTMISTWMALWYDQEVSGRL
jgi:hypothetical protein